MLKKHLFSGLLVTIFLLAASTANFAQTNSFSKISSVQLRNANPILEDGKVRGYYVFYKVEKKDRNTVGYKIQFLNENLETTASKSISGTKYLNLMQASYNGTNIMLKFMDAKERKYTFRQYDRNGDLASRKTKEFNSRLDGLGGSKAALVPVDKRGFLDVATTKFKKRGFEINFFTNSKETRGWTYTSAQDSKTAYGAEILGAAGDIVLVSVTSVERISMKSMSNSILALDLNTGKKIFEKPLSKDDLNVIVGNSFIDTEAKEFTVFGTYFGESGDNYKKNGEGLYSVSFDFEGNFLKEKINLWEEDFGKLLPVSKKGKMSDLGFFYLHDVFKTSDGRIFAYGEQYRKAADAGMIALKIIASASDNLHVNGATTKVVVEDLLFFEFTSDFDLKQVEFFDKNKSNISLPEGYGSLKTFKLGMFVDMYDGFDYFYKSENKENNSVSVVYRDWNRDEKQSEVHSVTYVNGDFEKKMFPIETEAKRYGVMRGKDGHIVVMEYFKKEKRLDVRLEEFAY